MPTPEPDAARAERRRDVDDKPRDRDGHERRRERDDDRNDDRRRRRDRDRDRDRERSRDRDRDDRESRRERRRERERSRERSYDSDRERRRKERRRRRESRSRSPTDRRRRKEAKAEAKAAAREEARREAEMEHARRKAEVTLYSASTDNVFGDANLGERFEWHKKKEKEKKMGLSAEDIARKDALRRREAEEELAKLNKKRADREVERALREEEEARNRRVAEDAAMSEWVAREDTFLLEQSRRRAGIRLRMQRARAIDFLAINLRFADARSGGRSTAAMDALVNPHQAEVEREEEEEGWGWADAGFAFEIDEPWRIFDNLTMDDCVELEQDIQMYASLERSPVNIDFWAAMLVVCKHHLAQLRDPDHAVGGRLYNRDVDEAAGRIVEGLSLQKLAALEARTRDMLAGQDAVDVEFWDLVLKKISLHKAIVSAAGGTTPEAWDRCRLSQHPLTQTKLNAIHEIVLKNRLEQFKKRQREDAAKAAAAMAGGDGGDDGDESESDGDVDLDPDYKPEDEDADEQDFIEEYERGMSPEAVDMLRLRDDDARLPVVKEGDFWRQVFAARRRVTEAGYAPARPDAASAASVGPHGAGAGAEDDSADAVDNDLAAERHWRARIAAEARTHGDSESEEDMDEGDLAADLPAANYDWGDKYRPRKPRYYNRVHTGYEWTQYNQSHYDKENPPPKVVMGYRFHIFYPDLIDKSTAPTYVRQRIPGDDDTELIVFKAGPPYEDVAFRIVRRPWDYSHRRGFRSHFDRGVLQLAFKYQRDGYRR